MVNTASCKFCGRRSFVPIATDVCEYHHDDRSGGSRYALIRAWEAALRENAARFPVATRFEPMADFRAVGRMRRKSASVRVVRIETVEDVDRVILAKIGGGRR